MTQLAGLYRGVVIESLDPGGQCRLRVRVPDVLGDVTVWARACMAPRSRALPRVGAAVWVQFEAGDRNRPVWLGVDPAVP